ncbi:MAG: cobalt ECF transporter T component CbiQ [Kiritimatiellia bacterium]|nr:cobalt ECF transporter T component CbiQ [Kiritimatiellia bacterium]
MGLEQWIEVGRMDELGRMATPVHRIDARAKAVTTIIFIIIIMSFPRYEVSALVPFLFYPLVLISLGRIPLGFIFRKVLMSAPFAFVIGIFNPFFDRQAAASIGPFVISGGWLSFTSIMLRFVLTVGAALTLVACTGMYRLCAGLERIGLPRVFVVQLLLLYRYLFVVADEGARMMRSLELRSAGLSSVRLVVYGSLVGHLLLRSMARAERIYQAMVARGFDGEIKIMQKTSLRLTDWAFLIGWTAFFVVARLWNLADYAARLLMRNAL